MSLTGSYCPYIPDLQANYVTSLLSPYHSPEIRGKQFTILYDIIRDMDIRHFQTTPIYAGSRHWKPARAPTLREVIYYAGRFELEIK